MLEGTAFLISVYLFLMEDRSSLQKYMKVHCDMQKLSSQSCSVNGFHNILPPIATLHLQIILSGNQLQQFTDINTLITP